MPSKLKKAIAAVKDQTSISLAKVASNNTSNLEVLVVKATTHDNIPIDDRYVNDIVRLVSSSKIYAAACARAIGKRIGRTRNWVVALKSLMLVLRIFQDGDPYFPREVLHAMKRGAKILNLSSFRDDSNSSSWDFTAFVRTFALYLDERLECFLTGKLQRRYTCARDKEFTSNRGCMANEPVRDMKPAMLLDRISYWQRLLERAIATRPTGVAKTNRLVQTCLYAIVQESFDFYRGISDGLALLLDSFFHLQYQNCVSAFQTCVKATKQFAQLNEFYSLCKSMGVGRTSEYPSVQTISEELMETLQEFLKDQSSFPAISKSTNRQLLLLPAPSSSISRRHDVSYGGQSDFSTTTEAYSERSISEFGSQCTSLEDLISATETGSSVPAISIDLEAYPDQFEKNSQRDFASRLSDTGSAKSLPASTSIADLTSLDDWPEVNDDRQDLEEEQQDQNESNSEPKSSAKGWDFLLAEVLTSSAPSSSNAANSLNAFHEASTPSTQPLPNVTDNLNVFPDVTTSQSTQLWPNATINFNAFPDTITSSVQHPPDTANSLNAFPEAATSSTQLLPSVINSIDSFPGSTKSSTQASPDLFNSLDAFPGFPVPEQAGKATSNSCVFPHQGQGQKGEDNSQQEVSETGWELALVEGHDKQEVSKAGWELALIDENGEQEVPKTGWELALVETTTQPDQSTPTSSSCNISTLDSLYNQTSGPMYSSNPFLEDPTELSAISNMAPTTAISTTQPPFPGGDMFSSVPSFQATPTFSTQNLNMVQNENDPFAEDFKAISSGQMFDNSMSQQNVIQEQQLWLQNQNKIIANRKV